MSIRSAPCSCSRAAHSYALWRPPTINTRAPASSLNSTRSHVWADRVGRQRRGPVREGLVVPDAGRGHDGVGADALAARPASPRSGRRPSRGRRRAPRAPRARLRCGEPLGVVEEQVDRDRVDVPGRDPALLEVRFQRRDAGAVQVPVGPGAQEHARGHVLAPEAHRPAPGSRCRCRARVPAPPSTARTVLPRPPTARCPASLPSPRPGERRPYTGAEGRRQHDALGHRVRGQDPGRQVRRGPARLLGHRTSAPSRSARRWRRADLPPDEVDHVAHGPRPAGRRRADHARGRPRSPPGSLRRSRRSPSTTSACRA